MPLPPPVRLRRCRGRAVTAALAALALLAGRAGAQEEGRPFLRWHSQRDYRAHNQVWSFAQDARGMMLAGNNGGLIEWDGAAWRFHAAERLVFARGLAHDPTTDRLYVGGVNELGYFAPPAGGARAFVSLLDRLPADARRLGDLQRAWVTAAEGVFFAGERVVLRWHDDHLQAWPLEESTRAHLVGGVVHLQARGRGLRRWDGRGWAEVPAPAEPFRDREIAFLDAVPDAAGNPMIAGTTDGALFVWKPGNAAAAAFAAEGAAFLRGRGLRHGKRLRDGSLALATEDAGVLLLGPGGEFRGRLGESTGLASDVVLGLGEDRDGGLWLGLNSGCARAELPSAVSLFDSLNGFKRITTRDIVRVDGALWLATTTGVFRLAPADPARGQPARVEAVPGFAGETRALLHHPRGGLLVGGADGVRRRRADGAVESVLAVPAVLTLARSRLDPDRVFVGHARGLRSLRCDALGRWIDEGAAADWDGEARTIVETSRGTLWLGTATQGILRAEPAPGGARRVQRFFETDGLPTGMGWPRVLALRGEGDEMLFATQRGLYRLDEGAGRFEPARRWGPWLSDGSQRAANLAQDAAGGIWLTPRAVDGVYPDPLIGRAGRDGSWRPVPRWIAQSIGELERFYPETDPAGREVLWIGGTEGVARVDLARLGPVGAARPPLRTFLRRVLAGGENVPLDGPPPSLPHARHSLRFEFGSDDFGPGPGPRLETRLEGHEAGAWTPAGERAGAADWTNLPAGSYVFRLRGADPDGRAGSESSFAFAVQPPWHGTAWAWAGFALAAGAGVVGLVRWRLRRAHAANARLEAIVAERTAALRAHEGEMAQARDAAESANRAKSAFLANMSHELRTPLNGVLGFTQIVLKDPALAPEHRERLGLVAQSGEHLLGMINEVLDLSKIEAGRMELASRDFDLPSMLRRTVEGFRPRAAEKGLELRLTLAPDLPRAVRADEGRLRQVLVNLLGNAVKFTERGAVDLRAAPKGSDRVCFEVRDTGLGIPADRLPFLFQAFQQAAPAELAAQGAGLGLAISRRLVEFLGGHLQVETTAGEGSTFWFALALPEVAPPPTAPEAPAGTITGYEGGMRRVLVADDEPQNRLLLRSLLQPLGFAVEEVTDGGKCLEACERRPPDLLLLDLRMPRVDGLEVARALRRSVLARGVKIIAVSASVFESDAQEALEAGCDDFVPKPFREEQLLAAMARVLGVSWRAGEPLAATAAPSAASSPAPILPPPAEELEALLELSQRGDIVRLKRRLAALAEGDARYAPFFESLRPFIAAFQMNRIRDALEGWISHGAAENTEVKPSP